MPARRSRDTSGEGWGGVCCFSGKAIYDTNIIYHGEEIKCMVDVGDTQLRRSWNELSKEEKRSRAALIREAIDDFLAKRRSKHEGDAFGLWGKRKVDGLAYQEKARSEW